MSNVNESSLKLKVTGRILSTLLQVKRVMERLDHDGDGKLDFEEFQNFIKPKSNRVKSAHKWMKRDLKIAKYLCLCKSLYSVNEDYTYLENILFDKQNTVLMLINKSLLWWLWQLCLLYSINIMQWPKFPKEQRYNGN